MQHEVVRDLFCPENWRVEWTDFDGEGECYVTIFSGPRAKERAEEYAAWRTGRLELNWAKLCNSEENQRG